MLYCCQKRQYWMNVELITFRRCQMFQYANLCKQILSKTFKDIHVQHLRFLSSNKMPLQLSQVVEKLNSFAPENLAESWDNVGLLIEPNTQRLTSNNDSIVDYVFMNIFSILRPIQKIFLTNDLTERVLGEAVESGCELIISYHPPVFAPLKRVTQR